MRRRDRQNEIVVALIVTVAMAFALALSILLTLGGQDDDRNDTASATAFATLPTQDVGVAPTEPTITEEATTAVTEEIAFLESPTTQAVVTEAVTAEFTEIVTEEVSPTESPTRPTATPVVTEATTEPSATETPLTLTATVLADTTEEATSVPSLTETEEETKEPQTSVPSVTLTPTPSRTRIPSATATASRTNTPRPTRTPRPTLTYTPSATNTPSRTPRPTATDTPTPRPTRTPSPTRTLSPTPTRTPTRTLTMTPVPTYTTISLMLPSPTVCAMVEDWDIYTVQRGDTLFSIAKRADIRMEELATANCISNTALIFAGQALFVPPGSDMNQTASGGGVINSDDAGVVQCTSANAQITSPDPGAQLDGVVTLYGVAGGANFGRYVLGWRPDAPNEIFRVFDERYQTSRNVLGQINTDLLQPGLVWFSLTVLDQQGGIIGECAIRVRLQE